MRSWCILLAASLSVLLAPAVSDAGFSKENLDRTVNIFNESARTARPSSSNVSVNYVEVGGVAYGYYLPSRFERLARDGSSFTIANLKVKRRRLVLTLLSADKGRLQMQIFAHDRMTQSVLDSVAPLVLRTVFAFGEAPAGSACVGNAESRLVHLASCNHLPAPGLRQPFTTLDAAQSGGFSPCAACFPAETVLPYDNYTTVRMDAIEAARIFEVAFPPVTDPEAQARLSAAGESILAQWPLDLVGFEYVFRVVHSNYPTATSFPTGFVYVTDSLLRIIERPQELDFVLAHEIAHVELHLAPVGTPAPPAATTAGYAYLFEWRRYLETTADLLAISYLSQNGDGASDVASANSILAKLQFVHEAMPDEKPDLTDTHPTYAQRLALFGQLKFVPAPRREAMLFSPAEKQGEFLVQILGKSSDEAGTYLHVLIEGKDSVNKAWTIVRGPLADATLVAPDGTKYPMTNKIVDHVIDAGDIAVATMRIGPPACYDKFDVGAAYVMQMVEVERSPRR